MNRLSQSIATALLMLCASLPARAGWQVWVAPAGQRVLRAAAPAAVSSIDLAAARNEARSFQILMRSDEPVRGIDLKAGVFGDRAHPAARVRLYRQHQLEITSPTLRNRSFTPGWYPDPLIPFDDPLTGKPFQPMRDVGLVAVPFDLPAAQTHGFWVDVDVPPGAPAGDYAADFTLTAAGGQSAVVTAHLKIWDFELSAVPALQTAFGSPADRYRNYYAQRARAGQDRPVADWPALQAQCDDLLAEHRVSVTPPSALLRPERQPGGTMRIPDGSLDELARFLDRYPVNALEVPKSYLIDDSLTTAAARQKLAAGLAAYDAAARRLNRPNLTFFLYLIDEPNDAAAYAYIRKWGQAVRQARSVVKVMVTEQTQPEEAAWGDLYGAVDIWCPLFPHFDAQNAAARQRLGETVWAYNALCQRNPTPWWHIDYPLLNYRVPAWIAWRYRIRGLLYWGGMSYWNETADPWSDAWTYGRKLKPPAVFNGEGTLVYPGRPLGYEGIAPSLRLKALRDGIEDYEYLALLEKKGLAAEADQIVRPLAESWFKWDADPAAYDQARARLAALIMR